MSTRPIKISVLADADKARKEISSFGSTLKGVLGAAAIGIGFNELADGVKSVVSAASDAQQSLGATESIYGKYADTVIKRSKEAADAVGLSANDYRESSNLLGALFKNQGVALDRLSGKTDTHLKLAADLSAMYGGTVADSVDALTAAYKGEFNQLEKYGVSLKQDTINTQANQVAKKKYGKALKELDPKHQALAKQLATQQLLFKQTGDAAGTFAKESNTLAGQQQRLNAELADARAEIGEALLPILTDLSKWTRDEVVPELKDFAKWLGENKEEIRAAGQELGGNLMPVLETFGDVLGTVVDVVKAMPEPMRGLVLQAGLAALALPKLSAAATTVTTGLGNMTAGMKDAEKRSATMGTAMRNVAGVGGMVLLAQGASSSNDAIKALSTSAGAALLGFSVGGPVGAAVFGLGGLMVGLSDGTNRADEVAKNSITTWQTYASTLDTVAGRVTDATKAMVIQELQQNGVLAQATKLGIAKSTLVNGVLGQAKASGILSQAIKNEEQSIRDAAAAYNEKFDTSIARSTDEAKAAFDAIQARRASVKEIRAEIGEVQKSTAAKAEEIAIIKKLPTEVVTRIQTPGAVDSAREVAELAKLYGLTPKQIKTVIAMTGKEILDKDVKAAQAKLKSVGEVSPSNKWQSQFAAGLKGGKQSAQSGSADINALLGVVGDVKPKIRHGAFGQGLSGDLSQLKALASSGGAGIGNNLGSGMYNGLGNWVNPLTERATSMVRGAIRAANYAGDIRSPSRETMYTGDMLGAGLAAGLTRSAPKAKAAATGLVAAVLAGVDDGRSGVDSALDKVTAQIRKSITGKNDGAREKALLKRLAERYKLLRLNGTAQDRVNQRLETARDRLKDLTQEFTEYAKAIKDSVISTGDVTQLGKQEDGSVSITSLLNELQSKVLRAERFASLIQKLQSDGLSRSAIEQMLNAGPEAALATVEAIEFGGSAAIAEVNALQARLAATGDKLGAEMADRYFGAGVDAAAGIVKGLEAEAARLDRAAISLANALVAAVKRALGIRSPSRVFADIGDNVTKGLVIGLDNTYVKRAGASAADSLQKGFGTPALTAFAAAQAAAGGPENTVRIRLSAERVSQLQRGREIQADLDFARGVGVLGESF